MKNNPAYIFGLLLLGLILGCNRNNLPDSRDVFLRTYGTEYNDIGANVVQTDDGGFTIAGSIWNYANGEDIVLMHVHENGEKNWARFFLGSGEDHAEDLLHLADGGYLIVGNVGSGPLGGTDIFVTRTDAQGGELWRQNLGGAQDDVANAARQTSDGGFVIVGKTGSFGVSPSNIYPNAYILKLDENGNLLWTRTYGDDNEDVAHNIALTSDGGFAVVGSTYSDSTDYDAVIWRLDMNGDSVWHYTTQTGDELVTEGKSILTLSNGNFALLGTSGPRNSADIFVEIIGYNGLLVSYKHWIYGGLDNEEVVGKRFVAVSDSEFVIAGSTMSEGHGANDIFLFQTKPHSNLFSWAKYYGGTNDDHAKSVIATAQNGYAVLGYSKSFAFNAFYDIVLLKTYANGEMVIEDN
jgi:hypothetical protein